MTANLISMLSWLLWVGIFASSSHAQANFTRGQKFQIILLGTPDMSKWPLAPLDAPVWDIDLFDNDVSTIRTMKAAGKIVICYFSAGTYEDWRDDAKDFPPADLGKVLPEWPNERWIKTGSTKVREVMAKRIKIASEKGCDAIDPDNTDGYQNDNGVGLRDTDLIEYITWMQKTAEGYGMKIGLKNSLNILDRLTSIMDFAVNEQCAQYGECAAYDKFLAANKPVFHIEYPTPLNPSQANSQFCRGPGTNGMSTILKEMQLNGATIYCDGSRVDTPTKGGASPPRPSVRPSSRPPWPPRPSTTRRSSTIRSSSSTSVPTPSTSIVTPSTSIPTPTDSEPPTTDTPSSTPKPSTTQRPSTTLRPSTTPRPSSTRTSSPRPSSTPGNPGGGCKQKHWDQCGGNDWKGCTTCESGFTCKPVSPPWYYQCL